ncbi:MAG: transposase [Nitrospirales bacterium]
MGLAYILRAHGQAYLAMRVLSAIQEKAWQAIVACALLFNAVSATLNAFAANPRWLGGTPSFTLVLHTWKQDLGRHLHIHALVAGGTLLADGNWVGAKRGFLFPVRALSSVYRGKFLDALDGVRGELRHDAAQDDTAWRNLFADLRRHDWVVYAKQPLGGPAQVLEYLGRYTHRVAISNERILGMAGNICASACAIPPTATADELCCWRQPNSSAASCCMCCPRGSSASAITG